MRQAQLYTVLASHTTYVVCLNFIQFNVDSERQIFFLTFSRQILFTLRIFARNLLGGNQRQNVFFFIFRFDVWPRIRTRALRLMPTRPRWLLTKFCNLMEKFVCLHFIGLTWSYGCLSISLIASNFIVKKKTKPTTLLMLFLYFW